MKQLIPTDNYDEYKRRQWKEVDRLYELKLFSKHVEIISEFHLSEEEKKEKNILCIGSRYGIEVEAFTQLGYSKIKAIDIYPRAEFIDEGDMHNLPYLDNTFNMVYTHHSLDHSLFPKIALKEMYRVSNKNAIWIHSIPFDDYDKEEAIDFDSADEIISFFKKYTRRKLYIQEVKRLGNGIIDPSDLYLPKGWSNELRLIIEINK